MFDFQLCKCTQQVSAVNGAESAVLAHGGVLSVLKKARLDLTVHRPVSMQHELWLKSGLCSEEFGTDVVFFSMEDYDKIEHVLNQHGRTLLLRGSSVMRSVLRHIRWVRPRPPSRWTSYPYLILE